MLGINNFLKLVLIIWFLNINTLFSMDQKDSDQSKSKINQIIDNAKSEYPNSKIPYKKIFYGSTSIVVGVIIGTTCYIAWDKIDAAYIEIIKKELESDPNHTIITYKDLIPTELIQEFKEPDKKSPNKDIIEKIAKSICHNTTIFKKIMVILQDKKLKFDIRSAMNKIKRLLFL